MSVMKHIDYVLTGPTVNKIYTQTEMAKALSLTETRLIGALGEGIGLCYHAHPAATGNGYWFNQAAYNKNIAVWE